MREFVKGPEGSIWVVTPARRKRVASRPVKLLRVLEPVKERLWITSRPAVGSVGSDLPAFDRRALERMPIIGVTSLWRTS